MFDTLDFWPFLLASFLLWITPGPDTMYILTRSISQGRWAGVLSSLGIGSGVVVHTVLAAFGLSAILMTSAWVFATIKLAGAGYLIYLGLQTLSKPAGATVSESTGIMSSWRILRQGFMTNALNPKVAVFFLVFLPQFVDTNAELGPIPFLFLGAAFVTGGTLWCVLVAVGAARASQAIRHHPSLVIGLERAAGCVYLGLGLNLLRSKFEPT